MAHEKHLKNNKYRQWVKAGLGLGYLKEGLAPFCDDIGNQQHKDIINKIQQTKTPRPNLPCGVCQLTTLKPDHVRVSKGICPLKQDKCNCCFPNNKRPCPNNVCGAIYDSIIQNHASIPPAPFWKNSDVQQWSANPWSVCQCFINAPGYKDKTTAADTDCSGLLHVIINNIYFHNHIGCNVTGSNNLFLKVRQYRNDVFHSSSMELEERVANSYIDGMIAVLQDGKELVHRQDAQQAVLKLQDLKKRDFIITTEGFEEILRQIKEEMAKVLKSTENVSTKEEYDDLKMKLLALETKMTDEKQGKLENEKELVELKKTISDLESQTCKGTKEKLETEREHIDLKKQITALETVVLEQKEEIATIKTETSSGHSQADYEQSKLELQKEMIASYCKNLLNVPAMPLLPRGQKCSFSEIYVRPTIIREIRGEKGDSKEIEVKSMSEIFMKNGVPLKHIYVLGDAGSGKSSFCKYLVNCWCIAQSDAQSVEDEFDGVKEMKKFDIMFYISLRHNQDIDSVQDMITNQYDIDISIPVLKTNSAKIIILLDGLDEWSSERKSYNQFQTMGLPKQDVNKDYTIVTTSRPWKVHTLGISETEIEQLLNLKEFDVRCEWEMVDKTVSQLNIIRHASKDARVCKQKLEEDALKKLKKLPIMLQQLICLWFDGKLDKSSKCAIYTGMLELFFTWNDMKTTGTSARNMTGTRKVDLPKYLADRNILKLNSHLIYDVSQLAYETLFNCPKNKSLTFDISMFIELEISYDVRENCLKLGIITEDECPSLSVSEPPRSLFSFIHKSMQEFLAVVFIGINFNATIGSSDNTDDVEQAKKFIGKVFQKCTTVNDILEQSNAMIMLCGLEPRLATHVSKYIYDTVSADSRVQEYRRTVNTKQDDVLQPLASTNVIITSHIYMERRYIFDIQNIMIQSLEELNATCIVGSKPVFYIGDLVIKYWENCDIIYTGIDQKQIATDYVLSINADYINTKNVKFTKYLPMFHHLEKLDITYEYESQMLTSTQSHSTHNNEQRIDDFNHFFSETIKVNTLTLISLSIDNICPLTTYESVYKTVVGCLPSMTNLVAIRMGNTEMSHDDITTFCNFLERTSHLEQIHLGCIYCEYRNDHDVNLSKLPQLQYLKLSGSVCGIGVDTTNIEVLKFRNLKDSNYKKAFDLIKKSNKLIQLELYGQKTNKFKSYHNDLTSNIVTVLPLLHNLSELELHGFRLTDNIIRLPLEMKSLKHIVLDDVDMRLKTWQKFVDSLPVIPHTVDVIVMFYYIIREHSKKINDDIFTVTTQRGEKRKKAAIQYVKDQEQLFHIKCVDSCFEFSTKKSD